VRLRYAPWMPENHKIYLMKSIVIKRVYEEAQEQDGYRLLVDRLWPRGVSKEKAQINEWNKELAPSTELRKWFDHIPERFEEFAKRYEQELSQHQSELSRIAQLASTQKLCLLYGAKDEQHNQAVVLKKILENC